MNLRNLAAFLLLLATTTTSCGRQHAYDFKRSDIILGLECDYAPFNWESSSPGAYGVKIENSSSFCSGYDIRVASHIANNLGKTLKVKKMAFDGLIPALKANSIDLVIAGMSPTETRKKEISFSDNYYLSEQTIVVRANSNFASATTLADFSGAKIVAQISTLQDQLIDQIPGVNHSLPADSYPEMVAQVKNNVADGLVAELPVAQAIIRANPTLTIIRFAGNAGFTVDESEVAVAVGFRKIDEQLREEVNAALALLPQTTRDLWMETAVIDSENA